LGMLRFRDMPPLQSYLEKKVAFFFAFNSENRYMPEALLNQLPMGRIRDSKASAEITVAFGLQGVFQWSHSQIPEVEKS